MKKLLILVLVIFAIAGVILLVSKDAKLPYEPEVSTPVAGIDMCFAKFFTGANGMEDRYILRMHLLGGQVTGEFDLLPAEKDMKVGSFEGTVSAVDPQMMARTGEVWWKAHQEGTEVTEELRFIFGEGTASIASGDMVDRGDGVYVYAHPAALQYELELTDIGCDELTERQNAIQYLRDNIQTLSPTKAVLGGSWYVVSYTIDTTTNSGTMLYEDGHIQESAAFTYSADAQGAITSMQLTV